MTPVESKILEDFFRVDDGGTAVTTLYFQPWGSSISHEGFLKVCYIWCAMDPIFSHVSIYIYIPAPWIRHGFGMMISTYLNWLAHMHVGVGSTTGQRFLLDRWMAIFRGGDRDFGHALYIPIWYGSNGVYDTVIHQRWGVTFIQHHPATVEMSQRKANNAFIMTNPHNAVKFLRHVLNAKKRVWTWSMPKTGRLQSPVTKLQLPKSSTIYSNRGNGKSSILSPIIQWR